MIPAAIRAASADAGGRPVRVIGWCLGGIMALLAHAADADLPIEAAALVASPWDVSKVPLVAPLRPIDAVTRGWLVTQLYRGLGGAPAPLVKRGYQLAGFDKYVMKPWTVASNLTDRELLAQIEAVDAFMARMHAYPGRTFGQLYHRFFRTNDLADGRLALTDGAQIDLADVTIPLLAIAGPRRRDRARGGVPPPRRAGAERGVACSSRRRRAGTSACSPAALRAARRGRCSTRSWTHGGLQRATSRDGAGTLGAPMHRLTLVSVAAALAWPASAGAQAPVEPVIPAGATAAGLDIGNLTFSQAEAKLLDAFAVTLGQPVEVRVAGRRRVLDPRDDRLRVRSAQDGAARVRGGARDAAAAGRIAPRRRAAAHDLRPREAGGVHGRGRPRVTDHAAQRDSCGSRCGG